MLLFSLIKTKGINSLFIYDKSNKLLSFLTATLQNVSEAREESIYILFTVHFTALQTLGTSTEGALARGDY